MMDSFNNSCVVHCLTFKLSHDKTTDCLRAVHFFEGEDTVLIRCTRSYFLWYGSDFFRVWWMSL